MKPKVAIIDYGMGNLRSVSKALELAGADVIVSDKASIPKKSDALVFPGVGAFNEAVKTVKKNGFDDVIQGSVEKGKMFLGLCLGFQMLFDRSCENGVQKGLGLIKGDVKKFSFKDKTLKVPHMGWNTISYNTKSAEEKMFKGIPENSYFYFVHSYYCAPIDKKDAAGLTEYGIRFCSAAIKDNIWGCQFHPEKSGDTGLKLLRNFIKEI